MARGWDRKPPSSPFGQFGQMLKGALGAAQSAIGDGKAQLDEALLKRRHREKVAALGEAVLRLVHAGRLDAEDFPELAGPIDAALASEERMGGQAGSDDDRPPWERPAQWRPRQDAVPDDEPIDEDAADRARARAAAPRRSPPWQDEPDDPDEA